LPADSTLCPEKTAITLFSHFGRHNGLGDKIVSAFVVSCNVSCWFPRFGASLRCAVTSELGSPDLKNKNQDKYFYRFLCTEFGRHVFPADIEGAGSSFWADFCTSAIEFHAVIWG
jgi:hypothetical protein